MSNKEWTLLYTAQSYDEAKDFVNSQLNVCQYRRSDLNNHTKYSFRCSEYHVFFTFSVNQKFGDQLYPFLVLKNIHTRKFISKLLLII